MVYDLSDQSETYQARRVIEFQAFLVKVIGQFELATTEKSQRIRREAGMVMFPAVDGEVEKGIQLPLRVSVAPRVEKGNK